VTKKVKGLKGKRYKEWWRSLGLFSFEKAEKVTSLQSTTSSRRAVEGEMQVTSWSLSH